jgi:pyrimidine operon attenuation protein/uracil phosphoribosyltransferase
MSPRSKILNINEIDQKLKRLAWQVYEKNSGEKEIIVVGISERGLILAKQLADHIQEISNIKTKISHLELDKDNPYNKEVSLNLKEKEYSNKVVILVDDVLNSGKTLMYAAKHF